MSAGLCDLRSRFKRKCKSSASVQNVIPDPQLLPSVPIEILGLYLFPELCIPSNPNRALKTPELLTGEWFEPLVNDKDSEIPGQRPRCYRR